MSGIGNSTIDRRWRWLAVLLAQHGSRVLQRSRSSSPFAEAMRRELDYIEDDRAALRWAIGCVTASYTAQSVAVLRFCGRILSRPLLAAGMLLSVALALAHANDVARRPDCARPNAEMAGNSRQAPDPFCSDRHQPVRFNAKHGLTR